MVLYAVLGLLVEKYKCFCGHEASVVVLIAMAISFLAYCVQGHEFIRMMTFDPTFFFFFCLPPIVFCSGFNMRRKVFFENFDAVLIFGVISTVVQFFLFQKGQISEVG